MIQTFHQAFDAAYENKNDQILHFVGHEIIGEHIQKNLETKRFIDFNSISA